MRLHRLHPDDPESWGPYAAFEVRVVAMHEQSGAAFNPALLRQSLRERWITQPLMAGYWVFLDEDGLVAPVRGHLCSWINERWGTARITVFQYEHDPGFKLGDLALELWRQVDKWGKVLHPPNGLDAEACTSVPEVLVDLMKRRGYRLTADETIVRLHLNGVS